MGITDRLPDAVRYALGRGKPVTFIDKGGNTARTFHDPHERDRERLAEYEQIYERGGPVAAMVDTRSLMTFGTGVEFEAADEAVAAWLNNAFDNIDDTLIDIARDAYVYGDAFVEIIETRGGGFSHLVMVNPKTIAATFDDRGQILKWTQTINPEGRHEKTETFRPEEIAHFTLDRLGRQPLGQSLIAKNYDEIKRYARNQDAIQNALSLHGFPKYHIKVGREDGQVISDDQLRAVRNRFNDFDEKTNWTTGAHVDIQSIDTAQFDKEGITENDLMTLATGFQVPKEMAGVDTTSNRAVAHERMKSFERQARAEQRRLAAQFIDQIVRPVLEKYSPFPEQSETEISLTFGDVTSDQGEKMDWLLPAFQSSAITLDEFRERLDLPKYTGEEEDLGPVQPPVGEGGVGGFQFGGGGSPFQGFAGSPNGEGEQPGEAEPEIQQEAQLATVEGVPEGAVHIKDVNDAPPGAAIFYGPRGGTYYVPPGSPELPEAEEETDQTPDIEITTPSPRMFAANVNEFIRVNPKMGAFLTAHDPEHFQDHLLLGTPDGSAGVSVSPDGDIQNLYNNDGPKGAGRALLQRAIEEGGRTLDCYDGFLRDFYHEHGFRETGRIEFNPEFAPEGWDEDEFGQPDIVFMAYRPQDSSNEESSNYYNGDEWERAKRESRDAAYWGEVPGGASGDSEGERAQGARVGRRTRRDDSRSGSTRRRVVTNGEG